MNEPYNNYSQLELACMRHIHPDKRNLPFNADGLNAVIDNFHVVYPDGTSHMLTMFVTPTNGDRQWAAFCIANIKSRITPVAPLKGNDLSVPSTVPSTTTKEEKTCQTYL
jgi:hypothetical protein